MVEWMISNEKARNRPEALVLAVGLMNEGFLQPADDTSKEAAEGGEQTTFLDDTKALYYFVSFKNTCMHHNINEKSGHRNMKQS